MSDLEKLLRFGAIAEKLWHAVHLVEDAPANEETPLPDIITVIDHRRGRLKSIWEWLDEPKETGHA